jgi:hypothetical protein
VITLTKNHKKIKCHKMSIHLGCDKLKSTHYVGMEAYCALSLVEIRFYASPHYESNVCPKLITCMHRDNTRIVPKGNIFGLYYVILVNQM